MVKRIVVKKSSPKKTVAKGPVATVVGVDGKSIGKISLPEELFAVKINTALLAMALRVYSANQRAGSASTKTRGQVEGSTKKIYRQKGTGRARHGGIRAPIFVGGGITFGPKPRDYSLSLPKNMKRKALASALSAQFKDGNIHIVDGLDKIKPKTKAMAKTLSSIGIVKPTLLIISPKSNIVGRIARNINGVDIIQANILNPYATLSHKSLIFMKEAIPVLKDTFVKSKTI